MLNKKIHSKFKINKSHASYSSGVQLSLFRSVNDVKGKVCFIRDDQARSPYFSYFIARNRVSAICDFRARPYFGEDVFSHKDIVSQIEAMNIAYRSAYLEIKQVEEKSADDVFHYFSKSKKKEDLNDAMRFGMCLVIIPSEPQSELIINMAKFYITSCENYNAEIPFKFAASKM